MYVHEGKSSGEIANILTARKVGTNIDHLIEEGKKPRTKMHKGLFPQ